MILTLALDDDQALPVFDEGYDWKTDRDVYKPSLVLT